MATEAHQKDRGARGPGASHAAGAAAGAGQHGGGFASAALLLPAPAAVLGDVPATAAAAPAAGSPLLPAAAPALPRAPHAACTAAAAPGPPAAAARSSLSSGRLLSAWQRQGQPPVPAAADADKAWAHSD
eukprot:1136986-Pelagomonas_calceolata.AAC.2